MEKIQFKQTCHSDIDNCFAFHSTLAFSLIRKNIIAVADQGFGSLTVVDNKYKYSSLRKTLWVY